MHWDPREIPAPRAYSRVHDISACRGEQTENGTRRKDGTRVDSPKEIKLTEVMHTEFSWIVSCLPRVCASSCFLREKRKERRDSTRVAYRKPRNKSRYGGVYRESSEKAREQPVDFYFNSRRDISFEKLGRWWWWVRTFLSYTSHAIRAHSHGKPRTVGSLPRIPSTEACKLSSGPKRFLHICNGSSNLCATLHSVPASPRRLFFPLNSSVPRRAAPRHATETPSFRRSRSTIYFSRVGAQIGCIKRLPNRESETQTPYPIVRKLKRRACQRIAIPCVRPRLALNIRGCRQMDIR